MKRVDRNKILVRHIVSLGLATSQKDLGAKMGYENESYFSQIINEKVETPKDFILKLKKIVPDLNDAWLLTGNGKMLKGDAQYVDYEEVETRRMANVSLLSADDEIEINLDGLMNECNITAFQIATTIGENTTYLTKRKLLPRHIIALQKRYGEDVIDRYAKYPANIQAEVVESIPIVSDAVASNPNVDVAKYVEENSSELETINTQQILLEANVKLGERIKRTSMLPTFQPNDIVFIRLLEDKKKIVDGETYYFDCANRPTMVRLVKFEGEDKLRLIAKNPQYADIVIERKDVTNIGEIVALFRMSFGDQYSELENQRREQTKEREKKDAQLDRMLEMMQAQGEQQSKLIDYITKER